jgi:hypothetical protein
VDSFLVVIFSKKGRRLKTKKGRSTVPSVNTDMSNDREPLQGEWKSSRRDSDGRWSSPAKTYLPNDRPAGWMATLPDDVILIWDEGGNLEGPVPDDPLDPLPELRIEERQPRGRAASPVATRRHQWDN